ncbi:MAG: 30S ribosomal protein S16 [Melioribacteraceae bacterium]|nr:30S ribosomal protein S16 [Melioribacteraceae bacterium]MCF8264647.1 30S ribosomal protein S16 [Melioribacteraceae bacterium]MCF8411979.1 30S ribosomal protein S16 [Melioribacteraceae bacterium]MCF8431609.1 30S ribosomal protein S16 [Melioribacteraceae bacterium]
MAVKLRLRRLGKKRQPIYKVVAADARAPRDGRIIEALGSYNPKTDPATVEIAEDRALYWLGVGAQPTATVKNLLSAQGILYKRELMNKGLTEEEITSKIDIWEKEKEARLEAKRKKVEKKQTAAPKVEEKVEETKEVVVEKTEDQQVIEDKSPEVEGAASEKPDTEEKKEA